MFGDSISSDQKPSACSSVHAAIYIPQQMNASHWIDYNIQEKGTSAKN